MPPRNSLLLRLHLTDPVVLRKPATVVARVLENLTRFDLDLSQIDRTVSVVPFAAGVSIVELVIAIQDKR